ncbi:hypothetical protein [Aliiroseovarius sp. PrR006]|uniref:hypothetical protein n=1 Tax=Aliiroseovarius sp. PrR006 TaxID=2706883 RepID=UPI0013D461EE|nr:hypothetical protein [Aliiroseovarius sp. PrR006]NDW53949.1 hypothetical protein [Aliiroseovarius sp. PrR006]
MALPVFPERATLLLLGRWALNFDVDGPAQAWADDVLSWAAGIEADDQHQDVATRAIESGALYTLADLPSPAHWGEISDLIRDAVRDVHLSTPDSPDSATRWLARVHLMDILAAEGDGFDALKKVSRLWFDHGTPDLHQFYLFKHAIRDVMRDGKQTHIPGLTRDSWQGDLIAAINEWMEQTQAPQLL